MKRSVRLDGFTQSLRISLAVFVACVIVSATWAAAVGEMPSGDAALAHLRFDRAEGPMTAEEAQLQRLPDNQAEA